MRPRKIKEEDLWMLEEILEKWNGKLTWPSFTQAVAARLGVKSLSAHTLMGNDGIKSTFRRRKEALREWRSEAASMPADVSVEMLQKEVASLREQLDNLKRESTIKESRLRETLIRWQYNYSEMTNIDLSLLNKPVPTQDIDLDRIRDPELIGRLQEPLPAIDRKNVRRS